MSGMVCGNRRQGLWLFVSIGIIVVAAMIAAWFTRFHRQTQAEPPMHDQTQLAPLLLRRGLDLV
jgi:heme/copper-type cytochrome/quinol oxidase subunit 3